MSQYGYGYGPPQGYQPPNAYAHLPPPSYSGPLYNPGDAAHAQHSNHSNAALESYEHNRQTIPGLGLNFSNNPIAWQQPWPNGPHELPSAPPPDSRNRNDSRHTNTATNAPPQTKPKPDSAADDTLEEGELSEGELEDIYEPGQKGGPQSGPQGGQPAYSSTAQPRPGERPNQQTGQNVTRRDPQPSHYWEPEQSARERSGSYSPYLSPREINSNGQASSPEILGETSLNQANQVTTDSTSIKTSDQPNIQDEPRIKTVAEAKKQAQDAILRLWPLNVRYQNYIEEGIDKTLLDSLFSELGLDPAMAELASKQPTPAPAPEARADSKMASKDGNESKASERANETAAPEKPADKSEERKDRIARLLAAKNSKLNTTVAEPKRPDPPAATKVAPTVPTAPRAHGLTKTQSEKSKLIQQKMEALRKSREANASRTPQSQPPTTPAAESNLTQQPSTTPGQNDVSDPEPSDAVMPAQPSETLEISDSNGTPSIPGLFLSSTPQPSPVANQRKRPVASDLNEYSTAAAYKRPFGQNRESRPFLIDVSDDEDDAEMEIDSPEQPPASIHRLATPPRTTSFRDHAALSDGTPNRQHSSPKAGTPTGPSTGGNGLYNLESMNKKIEDMKRRIAVAEARKKAKQSSNGTPSLPQSQDQSKEGSVDLPNIPQPLPHLGTAFVNEADESGRSTPLTSQPASPTSLKLPKVRGGKREARSPLRLRIASERLPILEAHRKQQMDQLRQLQSEVAKIEKEIQDNLQEEERLRKEVLELESDQLPQNDSEPDVPTSEPLPPTQPAHETPDQTLEPVSVDSSMDLDHEGAIDKSESVNKDHQSTNTTTRDEYVEAPNDLQPQNEASTTARLSTNDETNNSVELAASAVVNIPPEKEEHQQIVEVDSNSNSDPDTDVAMDEDADSSSDDDDDDDDNDDDEGDVSDDYEPTEAGIDLPNGQSPRTSSPAPSSDEAVLETSEADLQGLSAASPVARQISAADVHSAPVSEPDREVDTLDGQKAILCLTLRQVEQPMKPSDSITPKSSFVPYETPLSCFHAYRFHPEYKNAVAGGLRSLTYSNKIDAKREVCPDELASGVCPRGTECEFQHFDNMKAPDDQILLQLGAYGNYEGDQKQQYIAGLRELLTDFRNRKIKDFQAISEGIVEYRTKFHGDKTKILPLGNVTI